MKIQEKECNEDCEVVFEYARTKCNEVCKKIQVVCEDIIKKCNEGPSSMWRCKRMYKIFDFW